MSFPSLFFSDVFGLSPVPAPARRRATVREVDDGWLLSMDLPGVPDDELKIEALDGELVISGERVDGWLLRRGAPRAEAGLGRFTHRLQMPRGVDPARLDARMEHGVLEIFVPAPSSQSVQVQLNAGEASAS